MRPLDGIRVLDMADEKGELCGRILADLGADVVRAEPPAGAASRRLPPFAPWDDDAASLYFAFRNANKRGITVDVSHPRGAALVERLLGHVDIWIESLPPGFLARCGLGPEAVLSRHPALVITSISDFGQTGPHKDYLGTDMIGFATGGLMYRAGAAHRPPLVAPGAMAYDVTGVTAGFATLMAYYKRLRGGSGQHLDVSVQESVQNTSDWSLPGYSASGQIGHRDGAGIYTLYRCADGFVRMIILVTHHWHALRAWMGEPEELQDPELDSFIQRLMRRAEVEGVIGAFFADKKKVDVAAEAQRRGIPATPLLEPGEVLSNPHTHERGTFRRMEILPGVEASVASGFFEVDGARQGPRERAPLPGEHNEAIYGGTLGLDASELDELRAAGVI